MRATVDPRFNGICGTDERLVEIKSEFNRERYVPAHWRWTTAEKSERLVEVPSGRL